MGTKFKAGVGEMFCSHLFSSSSALHPLGVSVAPHSSSPALRGKRKQVKKISHNDMIQLQWVFFHVSIHLQTEPLSFLHLTSWHLLALENFRGCGSEQSFGPDSIQKLWHLLAKVRTKQRVKTKPHEVHVKEKAAGVTSSAATTCSGNCGESHTETELSHN